MKKLLLSLALASISTVAFAQNYNQAGNDRMDRLERDLQLIQKQLATGGDVSAAEGGDINVGNARLGAQLSQIQEELRKIRGSLEQQENANKRNADALERLQKDNELRFQDIEKKLHAAATTPAPEAAAAPAASSSSAPTVEPATLGKTTIKAEDAKAEEKKPEEKPVDTSKLKTFDVARDHYNYAFRLLNQTKYDEAAAYFQTFTKAFPKDALIGNAYYWLGETYYIKRDYVKAADFFRQGFEALPNGPKAADNLLKLAMSLSALKRTEDACVVLKQVTVKFAGSSSVLIKKAEDEKVRMGCQ